jgi:hypothetical protein
MLAGSVPASADDAKKVVIEGEGPESPALLASLASKLASPYTEGDSAAFRGGLGPGPVRVALVGAAAKRKDRDADLVAKARTSLNKVHADRAIVVFSEKVRGKAVVHVWVVDAAGDAAEVDEDVHVAAGTSAGDAVWSAIASKFPAPSETSAPARPPAAANSQPSSAPAAPPAPSEPSPTAATPSAAPGQAPDVAPDATPTAVAERTRANAFASVGLQVVGGSRHFSYVDRLTGTLRPYDLFVAPSARISADLYPLSKLHIPVVSGLGLEGDYSHAFGLSSQDSSGTSVSTSWQAYDLGLRDRVPIGRSLLLGVSGGYGDTTFSFDSPVSPAEQLPSVDYKYLRGGVDGRYMFGTFSVSASVGYRGILSTGDFGSLLFPRATVGGVDASIGAAKTIASSFEVSVDVEYTRYFYNLLPQPGDSYVAGGALDEMASLSLGLAYLL